MLEHSLAGVLFGTPTTQAAPTPASGSVPSGTGGHSTVATKSAATVLNTVLTQTLAADAKASGSTQTAGGAPPIGASAAAAGTAGAALAAAQLTANAHVGSQQTRAESADALSSPVGSSAWTDELGAKVTWMAHQGIESASLQLSPEHLGPMQVSISVHNGQASVWFGAAQPETRTALQQSLPQLRQLFANQGLTLADTGVSREPPRGQGRQQSGRAATSVSGVAAVGLDGSATRTAAVAGLGLVDTYA